MGKFIVLIILALPTFIETLKSWGIIKISIQNKWLKRFLFSFLLILFIIMIIKTSRDQYANTSHFQITDNIYDIVKNIDDRLKSNITLDSNSFIKEGKIEIILKNAIGPIVAFGDINDLKKNKIQIIVTKNNTIFMELLDYNGKLYKIEVPYDDKNVMTKYIFYWSSKENTIAIFKNNNLLSHAIFENLKILLRRDIYQSGFIGKDFENNQAKMELQDIKILGD